MDTKTIETPVDKHKVEIKSWLSEKDYREIEKASIPPEMELKTNSENLDSSIREFVLKGKDVVEIMHKDNDAKIIVGVISINGSSENILERVLEMKKKDYDFIVEEIEKIIESDKKK